MKVSNSEAENLQGDCFTHTASCWRDLGTCRSPRTACPRSRQPTVSSRTWGNKTLLCMELSALHQAELGASYQWMSTRWRSNKCHFKSTFRQQRPHSAKRVFARPAGAMKTIMCSDITNTLVGISGETARWCESLCLLYVQCCHLSGGGFVFAAGVSHHTPPPPGGAGLSQLIIF